MTNMNSNDNKGADFKFAVCCWSTPKNTCVEDIEQCAAIGAQGVGLFEQKIAPGQEEEIEEALARHNMKAGIVVPHDWTILPVPLNPQAASLTWKDLSGNIAASCKRMARFSPVGVLVGPGGHGDPSMMGRPVDEIVEGLKVIADAAGEVGLRIAFEPYARRRGAVIHNLTIAMDVIDRAGRDNVDLFPDVWHYWPEPNVHQELRQYADRIIALQVNDARIQERSWCDRVQPGWGHNKCREMVATLIDAGFDGWYDYEVFSDDGRWGNAWPDSLWAKPHQEFLQEGYDNFARVHSEAKQMLAEGMVPLDPVESKTHVAELNI
ncbi:sugar phosphate isomerase/epimerase [Rhizorhapis sp.]|uniref:sugar phosphate isomerase/epimerase family protein n=1 Tax=Rhizorhapis sp. TaxID=1968842 RepID=UPI002B4859FC|nr:sugar phosphate isomerase/epimerase [Rhizorhapis sp.]HKR17986.1 sugar phosphate isomerase/epimerase [Rhizorhapis sp.]